MKKSDPKNVTCYVCRNVCTCPSLPAGSLISLSPMLSRKRIQRKMKRKSRKNLRPKMKRMLLTSLLPANMQPLRILSILI